MSLPLIHSDDTQVRRRTLCRLLSLTDEELSRIDPLLLNLTVAQGIPALQDLDVHAYQLVADEWAQAIRGYLHNAEGEFRRSPGEWKNDLAFFRLGVLCWYVDEILDIHYRDDQRELRSVAYTDPCDLFVNGVMSTRRGTCGNMAALHVVLGWRLGWPVSLACAGWHILCRYEDGVHTHNIEATNNGRGGFHSHPDEYYQRTYGVDEESIRCGSDLTALKPRQLLGLFIHLRARPWHDVGRMAEAAHDSRLGQELFPQSCLLRRLAREARVWQQASSQGPGPLEPSVAHGLYSNIRPLPQSEQVFVADQVFEIGGDLARFEGCHARRDGRCSRLGPGPIGVGEKAP